MNTIISDRISNLLGFPVPKSYARFLELTIADLDSAYWQPFEFLPFMNLDNAGPGAISISKPGDSVIFGWTGCDSEHFVFIIDDDASDDRERPVAFWPIDGRPETGLIANTFPEFLEWLAAIETPSGQPEEGAQFLSLIKTEFGVKRIRSEQAITNAARKKRLGRKNVFATQDNIGVVLPPDLVDRKFLRGVNWPMDGPYSRLPQPHLLDEAERRLALGEIGTALILARDYRFHHWYDDWKTAWEIIRRTSEVLSSGFRQLGRPMAATEIERQTEWNLMNVT